MGRVSRAGAGTGSARALLLRRKRVPYHSGMGSKRDAGTLKTPGGIAAGLDEDLLAFLDRSPTPYHAVEAARVRLATAGFTELLEREPWSVRPGGRYFVVRNGSSIAAIRAGDAPPSEAGFRLVGAHTDSPNLRLKPRPGTASAGHLLLDVEVYGSPILATWLDRDLSLAGRVSFRDKKAIATRLVRADRPLCRVSTLAIHLDRTVNDDGLKLDKHRHLSPTLGVLDGGEDPQKAALDAIAEGVGCAPRDVLGFDLCLYDVQRAAFVGRRQELVASARLDNLGSCHAALAAVGLARPAAPTAVALLYDHEEIGSGTAEGAAGAWTADLLSRLCDAMPGAGGLPRAAARSLLVSADMAHAVHPNRPEKHDGVHAPRLNGGPVVKTNASRRYGTDGETGAFFRALCAAERVPCQEFVSRADTPCGTTIGPIVAAGVGVRTVDVGNPMLSMHSARELAGRADVVPMTSVLTRFLSARDPLPW